MPPGRPTRKVGRPEGGTHRSSVVPLGRDHGQRLHKGRSSIDASVVGVGVLIAGRVAGGVMAGVVATVLGSPLPAMG